MKKGVPVNALPESSLLPIPRCQQGKQSTVHVSDMCGFRVCR